MPAQSMSPRDKCYSGYAHFEFSSNVVKLVCKDLWLLDWT